MPLRNVASSLALAKGRCAVLALCGSGRQHQPTSGVGARADGSCSPLRNRCSASGPISFGSLGLLLKASSGTTSMLGSISTIARTYHGSHNDSCRCVG